MESSRLVSEVTSSKGFGVNGITLEKTDRELVNVFLVKEGFDIKIKQSFSPSPSPFSVPLSPPSDLVLIETKDEGC